MWTAPLSTITDDDIRGTVEKDLLEKENRLKEKKKIKGKKPAESAPPAAEGQASSSVAIEDDVWSIPSEEEGPMMIGEGKPQKAAKAKKEDDAAVAARKAARERDQKWKQETGKATRCINNLNSVCHSLATMSTKVEKNPEVIPDKLTDGLKQAVTQMNVFKKRHWAASACVSLAAVCPLLFVNHWMIQYMDSSNSGVSAWFLFSCTVLDSNFPIVCKVIGVYDFY